MVIFFQSDAGGAAMQSFPMILPNVWEKQLASGFLSESILCCASSVFFPIHFQATETCALLELFSSVL
ncbi:hypothetical protein EGI05_04965 [Chryseobacterium daecheongense]|uniref:Uncharacterized protein n=1 Tax=Chryseobacterium daecheongense TaxID=192389 RepID=A0A3N0W5A6_9FLAO|nr:hypothetical protein EGI05_04965 [Chryseobacterium daecheongense]